MNDLNTWSQDNLALIEKIKTQFSFNDESNFSDEIAEFPQEVALYQITLVQVSRPAHEKTYVKNVKSAAEQLVKLLQTENTTSQAKKKIARNTVSDPATASFKLF